VILDADGPGGAALPVLKAAPSSSIWPRRADGCCPPWGARVAVLEWLMVQLTAVGPMFGQLVHFTRYAPTGNDYSLQRYTSEVRRLFAVLERRLQQAAYLGGESYSIADVATWPWIRTASGIYPWLAAAAAGGEALAAWPALGALVPPHRRGPRSSAAFATGERAADGAAFQRRARRPSTAI
jgi:GST-like protein